MILRRNGNKFQSAAKILPYFPDHKIYIEPFFGAGGMFFNKPKAKYNFLNDIDDDVFNLFMVVKNEKDELYKRIYQMPIHATLMKHWKNRQTEILITNFHNSQQKIFS
jgi:DNA adenine methylase